MSPKRLLERAARRLRVTRHERRARALERHGLREEAAIQRARTLEGWFTADELSLLYRTVKELPGPGNLAEIGSWKGRSTVATALALEHGGWADARIIAIDPHVGSEEHRERIAAEGPTLLEFRRNLRRARVGERVEEMALFSREAAALLARRGEILRFLLIDGAHDYASVRDDIRLFLPLVRDGGIVALHDCEPEGMFPGVWQAFQEELTPHAEVVARTARLMVTRVGPRGGSRDL